MNVCFLPSTWMRNQLLWEGNRVNQIKINEHWMVCDKLPASKKKNELYSLDSQQQGHANYYKYEDFSGKRKKTGREGCLRLVRSQL